MNFFEFSMKMKWLIESSIQWKETNGRKQSKLEQAKQRTKQKKAEKSRKKQKKAKKLELQKHFFK
jgi:hypothetical protein